MVRTITIGICEDALESKLDLHPSHLSLKVGAAGVSEGVDLQDPLQTYTIKSAYSVIIAQNKRIKHGSQIRLSEHEEKFCNKRSESKTQTTFSSKVILNLKAL